MKCPHCLTAVHEDWHVHNLGTDTEFTWLTRWMQCPSCKRYVIRLIPVIGNSPGQEFIVWPRMTTRTIPLEVEPRYADDYREAALVLTDSPKASAALSRRCLQHILRDKAGAAPSNLFAEIGEVIEGGKVPSWLAKDLDAARTVGNFAAHPTKSTSTGEIVDVEPGEAEWLLDVLDGLFDFYFVQPAVSAKRREALNTKLDEAGKQPLPDRIAGEDEQT